MVGEEQGLLYQIEIWDDDDTRREEIIALVSDHAVAQAAFAEAKGKRELLREAGDLRVGGPR